MFQALASSDIAWPEGFLQAPLGSWLFVLGKKHGSKLWSGTISSPPGQMQMVFGPVGVSKTLSGFVLFRSNDAWPRARTAKVTRTFSNTDWTGSRRLFPAEQYATTRQDSIPTFCLCLLEERMHGDFDSFLHSMQLLAHWTFTPVKKVTSWLFGSLADHLQFLGLLCNDHGICLFCFLLWTLCGWNFLSRASAGCLLAVSVHICTGKVSLLQNYGSLPWMLRLLALSKEWFTRFWMVHKDGLQPKSVGWSRRCVSLRDGG